MAQPTFEFPYGAQSAPRFYLEESFHSNVASNRQLVSINFENTIPSTKSHVMRVNFRSSAGEMKGGVLKLYDRRYPGGIRQTVSATAPSVATEAAYRSFVRDGKMDDFLLVLKHIYDQKPEICARDFLHNHEFGGASFGGAKADSMARFEAATWYECDKHFKNELKAYKQLEKLQGKNIPRLYAHVRLPWREVPQDALGDERWEHFLCVHGLLLEDIPGPTLKDWTAPGIAPDTLKNVADRAAEAI